MSIIPPPHPAPPPRRTVDEVGRQVKECRNCGQDIILSYQHSSGGDWLHPGRGYSALCTDVKRGDPK